MCVYVCLANILIFYFSATRRDIDLKLINDTRRVVVTSWDTLFDETIKTGANRELTSPKNTSIFDFNM